MSIPTRCMAVASLAVCSAFAQTPAASPAFEVASVKLADPQDANSPAAGMRGGPRSPNPGQFTCIGVTLEPLLQRAYQLRPDQVLGPRSLNSDKYDIVAKVPPGTTEEQFEMMIRNLLVDRLGLVVHRETRNSPVYDLVVAKGGPKLRAAEKAPAGEPPPAQDGPVAVAPHVLRDKDGLPTLPPGIPGLASFNVPVGERISARMQTLASLVFQVAYILGRSVVDKTELTETYDFDLTFAVPADMARTAQPAAPESPSGQGGLLEAASDPATNLSAALESQLGLKLESKKGPVEVLVVDKLNRTPTEN